MKQLLTIVFFAIGSCIFAQDGANDPTFNPDDIGFGYGDGFNGAVLATAIQDNGKIITGGGFSSFNGTNVNYLIRFNTEGTLDESFKTGIAFNNSVSSIIVQPDGKIIIGGRFTSYDKSITNRIVRLNEDGSLDESFNTGIGFNNTVHSLSIQNDGKIIAGGDFTSFNETPVNYIARLNEDGSLDESFNTGEGFNGRILTINIQADEKILVAGGFTTFNGTTTSAIARLNKNGSMDSSFNTGTGFNHYVRSVAIQVDGKIIVGGQYTIFNETSVNFLTRLNDDGSLDESFNSEAGFNSTVLAITIQEDEKILVGGGFTTFNGTNINRIARLNPDGSLDESFNTGTGFDSSVLNILIQHDKKILVGGMFSSFNGKIISSITRLHGDGSLDDTFNSPGTGFNRSVWSVNIQSDGKIIVGGTFTSFNGTNINRIARLNTNGTLDAGFDPGTGLSSLVLSSAIQSDGKIILGGEFTDFNGTNVNYIIRLNHDGSLDESFNTGIGFNNFVYSISIQADGKIIVGGLFTSYNGTATNRIARLNPDGTLDADFDPGTGFGSSVWSTAIQADGKIIVGGLFTSFNGTNINRIARLNANGKLDTDFDPGTMINLWVRSLAIQGDGKIIVAGAFSSLNGTNINGIVRLNTNGTLDTDFDPGTGFNNPVESVKIQSDGKIIVGGHFTSYNNTATNYITRLNTDGTLDTNFDLGTGFNEFVSSIAIQDDGKIIVGGFFTSYDGIGRNRIARLLNCIPTLETEVITACDSYTWIDGITYTTSTNTSTFTFPGGAENGCDLIVTLDLTINRVSDISTSVNEGTITANNPHATYQWIDCKNNNAPIQGANSQSFIPTFNGSFAVEITENGCTEISECVAIIVTSIGDLYSNTPLNIYPNPTNGHLHINVPEDWVGQTLLVTNSVGQVFDKNTITTTLVNYDLAKLPNGVYFILVETPNGNISRKIVKN